MAGSDSYWMIIGIDKSKTGSMDTFFDTYPTVNYAYVGCKTPATAYFQFPSGSKKDFSLRDLQMYTPYPTSTERGKLYLVDQLEWASNSSNVPTSASWVSLYQPVTQSYRIITPSLNDATLQLDRHIAQYHFDNLDDLWNNGWKTQRGKPTESTPLATQANWVSATTHAYWLSQGFAWNGNPNDPATTYAKEQIVANLLGYTTGSFVVQNALGLGASDLIKGAILIAGLGHAVYDDLSFRGIVPMGQVVISSSTQF